MSKRGFTLPEVTLSMLITSVIALGVGAMIVMCMSLIARNTEMYRAKQIGDGVFGIIEQRISCSVGIDLYRDTEELQEKAASALYVSELGRISIYDLSEECYISVFGDGFYGTAFIEVELTPDIEQRDIAYVAVKIYMEGDRVYCRNSAVRVLAGSGGVISGDSLNSREGGFYIISMRGEKYDI